MKALSDIDRNQNRSQFYRVTYKTGPYPHEARHDAEATAEHELSENLPDDFTGRIVDSEVTRVGTPVSALHDLRKAPTPDNDSTPVPHLPLTVSILVMIRPQYDGELVHINSIFEHADSIESVQIDWCSAITTDDIDAKLPD